MTDITRVRLEVMAPDLTPTTATWRDVRDLFDRLFAAVGAFTGEDNPPGLLPLALKEGSLGCVVQAHRRERQVIEQIRSGRSDRWSPKQLAEVRRFHRMLDEHGWQAGVRRSKVIAKFEPVTLPRWESREWCSVEARINQVGGENGMVQFLPTNGGPPIYYRAGVEQAADLGHHMYKAVLLEGERVTDLREGRMTDFRVSNFRLIPRRMTPLEGMAKLRELLEDDLRTVTATDMLRAAGR